MSDTAQALQFTADRGDARLRLDQALVRRLGREIRLSRTRAQQWIDDGRVLLDGSPASRASQTVMEGVHVVVRPPDDALRRQAPEPEDLPLDVLFEDDHLLAVNKPPGMVVHPTYRNTSKTLLNAVLWRLRDTPSARPGVLTRLDKDTSGLVLVALSPAVHAAVQAMVGSVRPRKEYLAVVEGRPEPPSGRIRLPLSRDPGDRRRVIVDAAGAWSETRYEVTASTGARSVVRCELVTGRTHQIRVHLASSGWPIVGDRTYGNPADVIARQALHAWRVTMPHPVTREPVTITAPPPADIAALLVSVLHSPGGERHKAE
jgi:23S rRNA pseudouridine1911/1915/1917 synthase